MGAALAAHPLPAVPGPRAPRVARVYALSEDGTLITLPLGELAADPAARRRAAEDEGRELRKLPQLPSFVSNEFFFQFDFTRPAGQVYYSGLYLDLGGQGVVATITVPYVDPASGTTGILGADVTFDLDWRAFARQIEPPLIAEVVTLPAPPEDRWRPWTAVSDAAAALPAGRDRSLARAVAAAAERERREGLFVTPGSVQHSVVEGQGAVAALQVAARDWLIILFPKTEAGFPVLSLAQLLLPMALLLGWPRSRTCSTRCRCRCWSSIRTRTPWCSATKPRAGSASRPACASPIWSRAASGSAGTTSGCRWPVPTPAGLMECRSGCATNPEAWRPATRSCARWR
jgi:hypothetical protein